MGESLRKLCYIQNDQGKSSALTQKPHNTETIVWTFIITILTYHLFYKISLSELE